MFDSLQDLISHYSRRVAGLRHGGRFLNVIVDLTNICNIRCTMCTLTAEDPHKQQPAVFLSATEFEAALADVLPHTALLRLSCGYEPLASPYFVEILETVRRFHVPHVDLYTNGTLLTGKRIDALIRCGVALVVVSFDSPDKATFEAIRVGARFDAVAANIRTLIRRRRELRRATPELGVSVTLMRSNLPQLEDMLRLAADLGASEVDLRQLHLVPGLGMEPESLADAPEVVDLAVNRARDLAATLGLSLTAPRNTRLPYEPGRLTVLRARIVRGRLRLRRALSHPAHTARRLLPRWDCRGTRPEPDSAAPRPYCVMPFNHVVISPGRRIKPCPFASDDYVVVADPGVPVGEIFRSGRFETLRQRVLAADPPPMCVRCPEADLYNTRRAG